MTTSKPAWTSDELNKIGKTEEIEIAAFRSDGTLRNPVTIWIVRLGDDLYVRSVKGHDGAWFRGVQASHQGRIQAGSLSKEVAFVDASPDLNDQIDAAYQAKYRRYPSSVSEINDPKARSATLKIVPR